MEILKNNLKKLLSDSFDKKLVDYAFRNLEDIRGIKRNVTK